MNDLLFGALLVAATGTAAGRHQDGTALLLRGEDLLVASGADPGRCVVVQRPRVLDHHGRETGPV